MPVRRPFCPILFTAISKHQIDDLVWVYVSLYSLYSQSLKSLQVCVMAQGSAVVLSFCRCKAQKTHLTFMCAGKTQWSWDQSPKSTQTDGMVGELALAKKVSLNIVWLPLKPVYLYMCGGLGKPFICHWLNSGKQLKMMKNWVYHINHYALKIAKLSVIFMIFFW